MKIKPSDIDLTKRFTNSVWNKREQGIVARNLCIIMANNGDKWEKFTWEMYQEACEHNVTLYEKGVLGDFVETGYLDKDGEYYKFTVKFIKDILPYVRTEAMDVDFL